ncbi:hypothetical protein lerEdw1_003082 [Lerista edwardsae]|nr:hypothetical protein lerEdw1_003082 [Lerista edwardsae]
MRQKSSLFVQPGLWGGAQRRFALLLATGTFGLHEKQEIKSKGDRRERKTRPDSPSNPTKMGFLPTFLLFILAAAVILLVVGSIPEIPPGVDEPAKLKTFHVLLTALRFVGKMLERLHICNHMQFVQYLQNGIRHGEDPVLFIKDVKFKHVPVRIYQPKMPSAGGRKGIVFFHGGGWVMGSIGTHEPMCRYFARESDSVVVSVE